MEIKLGELIVNFDSKRKPLSKMVREKMHGPYPYYGAACVFDYIDKYIFDGEYILLGEDGTVLNADGSPILQLTKGKFWPNNHTHVLKNNEKLIDFRYLYYLLKNTKFTEIVTGAVQQKISQGNMNNFVVDYEPDIGVQKRIAAVLSAIDDKIELNNKINTNLEEDVQAIYKNWFIDFAPFGGEVPLDWKKDRLGNVCQCLLGGTPSRNKPEYWNGDVPWINSGEINNFRITKASEYITKEGLERSSTKLLPKKATVLAITGATLGQISLLEIDTCANQSVIGVLPNDRIQYPFLYPLLCSNIAVLLSSQTGGAQQHINNDNVKSLEILIPSAEIMHDYCSITKPLMDQITINCFQNERLSELRDALLPKLMSGEIDVSNVEVSE